MVIIMRKQEQEDVIYKLNILKKSLGELNDKDIYSFLISYGFKEEDKINKKTKKRKGLVYDDESLSFIPIGTKYAERDKYTLKNYIKVYIPVNADSLKATKKKINNFLNRNRISSNSKVRNRTSSDDVVVRLKDNNDVESLRNYINKEHKLLNKISILKNIPFLKSLSIKHNIIKSNPFFVRDEHGISYTIDGSYTSANDQLSKLLEDYFDIAKEPTRDGFREYLKENYMSLKYTHLSEEIEIAKLIYLSMDDNFTYDKFIAYAQIRKLIYEENISLKDIINIVYSDLKNQFGNQADYLIKNIDKLQDNCFIDYQNYLLSRLYLSNEIVNNYFEGQTYNPSYKK